MEKYTYMVHFCTKKKGVSTHKKKMAFPEPVSRGDIIFTQLFKKKTEVTMAPLTGRLYWWVDEKVFPTTTQEVDVLLIVSPTHNPLDAHNAIEVL